MTTKDEVKIGAWVCGMTIAAGSGAFLRSVVKHLNQGATTFCKVGHWAGACCAAMALGKAADLAIYRAYKKIDELIPDEEEEESTGTYFEHDHGDSGL